jgi:hypothetical protein
MEEKKNQALKRGTALIIVLVFLTISEFLIGQYVKIWWGAVILLGIASIKAFFVVRDYMHVGRLTAGSEEVH